MPAVIGQSVSEWVEAAHEYAERVGNRRERAAFYGWLGAGYAYRLVAAPYSEEERYEASECDASGWEITDPDESLPAQYRLGVHRMGAVGTSDLERARAVWDGLGAEWSGWRAECERAAIAVRRYRVARSIVRGEWVPAVEIVAHLAEILRGLGTIDAGHAFTAAFGEADRRANQVARRWSACDGCGALTVDPERVGMSDYCESCAEDRVACDECDEAVWRDEAIYSEREGMNRCQECHTERRAPWESYGYRPHPIFVGLRDGALAEVGQIPGPFFGIEFEIDGGGDPDPVADFVSDPDHYAYAKQDGSLSDGVEIVSHPLTYEAAREWCRALDVDALPSWGWDEFADTAGMHIHVSRRAFAGRSHLARFGLLLTGSDYAHEIARRSDSYYSRRITDGLVARARSRYSSVSRYHDVNYATPDGATVEVRMFSAHLQTRHLLAALEITHAAFTYTRDLRAADVLSGALGDDAWRAWITDNTETYPTLAAALVAAH